MKERTNLITLILLTSANVIEMACFIYGICWVNGFKNGNCYFRLGTYFPYFDRIPINKCYSERFAQLRDK